MKTYESKAKLEFPVEQVLELISSTAYIEEEAVAIGAVKATASDKSRSDTSAVIIIQREDPSRDPGAKPGQTEKNSVTVKWDLKAMKDTWDVKVSGKEKLVKISGKTWLEPGDGNCIIREKGGVDIKIPIIGNMIAKGLVKDLSKNIDKKAALIRKKLG